MKLDKLAIIDSLASLVSVTSNPIDYIKQRNYIKKIGGTGLKPRDHRYSRRRERIASRFVKKKL